MRRQPSYRRQLHTANRLRDSREKRYAEGCPCSTVGECKNAGGVETSLGAFSSRDTTRCCKAVELGAFELGLCIGPQRPQGSGVARSRADAQRTPKQQNQTKTTVNVDVNVRNELTGYH